MVAMKSARLIPFSFIGAFVALSTAGCGGVVEFAAELASDRLVEMPTVAERDSLSVHELVTARPIHLSAADLDTEPSYPPLSVRPGAPPPQQPGDDPLFGPDEPPAAAPAAPPSVPPAVQAVDPEDPE
jgi:hypothetical protein